jgi:hypothetical protein
MWLYGAQILVDRYALDLLSLAKNTDTANMREQALSPRIEVHDHDLAAIVEQCEQIESSAHVVKPSERLLWEEGHVTLLKRCAKWIRCFRVLKKLHCCLMNGQWWWIYVSSNETHTLMELM